MERPPGHDHGRRKYGQKRMLGSKHPRLLLFFRGRPFERVPLVRMAKEAIVS